MEIVGGPYDGTPGLRWADVGEYPPPPSILLGTCPGDLSCGATRCALKRHPCYWLPGEEGAPTEAYKYELSESHIEPEMRMRRNDVGGKAFYVKGDLLPVGERFERELVPAGVCAGDGDLSYDEG